MRPALDEGDAVIAVVDSGGANLTSVVNALRRLGTDVALTADPDAVARAEKVILPGVGAAGDAMARLREKSLDRCVQGLTQPVLGICLGMQLLFKSSAEGPTDCLGVIDGRVERLKAAGLAVPHMGWNEVRWEGAPKLFKGVEPGAFFYFVHSFRAAAGPWVSASCEYGEEVPAAVEHRNFYGVQFHPERSSSAGAAVLRNFLELA
ncbi:MAG: imidazole glycerol phosphate synthase subunit HisH [Proteobacteria bacterium]|nr:imidazole glycerol phosphate synthase subunit HisH [Pseudomonadota bacterium]